MKSRKSDIDISDDDIWIIDPNSFISMEEIMEMQQYEYKSLEFEEYD
jgi:hypothetical protein